MKRLPRPGGLYTKKPLGSSQYLNLQNPTPKPVRTRFAPSPTGSLHLGSLRTAAYNYLLAKHMKGSFVLRLEDTDRKRLIPGAAEELYRSLKWAGLYWDEGPILQSERKAIYKKYADLLLKSGHAYECWCSKDRLDSLSASARQLSPPSTASYDRRCLHDPPPNSERVSHPILRFKSPEKYPPFQDGLHGTTSIQVQQHPVDVRFDDFTLMKSDGMPTYHFANVIDDHLMGITHVIRGEEWLPSTPKHIALYHALGWDPPEFWHIPLLVGPGGKKLSKRRSDTGIAELAGRGILPQALVNFVALLGWSPHLQTGESEVMSMKELENLFSTDNLTRGNVQVDMSKLEFFDHAHFRLLVKLDPENLEDRCWHHLKDHCNVERDEAKRIFGVLKDHVSSISDYVARVKTVLSEPQFSSPPQDQWLPVLEAASDGASVDALVTEFGKKRAFPALRYALLDAQPGVSVIEAVSVLGTQKSHKRFNAALQQCK